MYPEVWMYGTFDVDNFGDLLLPIIAQRELASTARLVPVSPEGQTTSFSGSIPSTDISLGGKPNLILLGGGNIVTRQLKRLAEYPSWRDDLDSAAFSIWVAPLIKAIQLRCPIVWNMPGCGPEDFDIGGPLRDSIQRWIHQSTYSSPNFRDPQSASLFKNCFDGHVQVLPDSAFGLGSVFDDSEVNQLYSISKKKYNLPSSPYLLVHVKKEYLDVPIRHLATYLTSIAKQHGEHVVLIPLGLCHGDLTVLRQLSSLLPCQHTLIDDDFDVLCFVSLIAKASYFLTSSYHGSIVASCFSTPFTLVAPERLHKFDHLVTLTGCSRHSTWESLILSEELLSVNPHLILDRVSALQPVLFSHWEHIRQLVAEPDKHFFQSLRLPLHTLKEMPVARSHFYRSITQKPDFHLNRHSCPICLSTSFYSHSPAHLKLRRVCSGCHSRPRHRAIYRALQRLDIKSYSFKKALMFSRDPSVSKDWFEDLEYSVFGKTNSLDLHSIDKADHTYDFIILNHVLEHVANDTLALKELARILAPNGLLVISVPSPAYFDLTNDWGFPDPALNEHYRTYGKDFSQFLSNVLPDCSIFEVPIVDPITLLPDYLYLIYKSPPLLGCISQATTSLLINYPTSDTSSVLERALWQARQLLLDHRFIRCSSILFRLKLSYPDELRVDLLQLDLFYLSGQSDQSDDLLSSLRPNHKTNISLAIRYVRHLVLLERYQEALEIASVELTPHFDHDFPDIPALSDLFDELLS